MLLNNGKQVALAPQGLAEFTPQLSTSYYYPQMGVELERNFAYYGELFRLQPWVFVAVSKRANAIARLPLAVWNEGGRTRQQDTSSGYAKLLANPCPYMDSFRFWFYIQAWRDIYGEAYLAIVRDESTHKPTGLLPMHPSRVAIHREPYSGTYTYTFQSGTGYGDGLVRFEQDDVVPILDFHPLRTERGMSRLEPLRSTLINEDSSRNAMSASWRNSGRPNVVLSTEKALGPEGRRRLRDSFVGTHAGSSQAGQTLVLEDGVKALPLQLSAVELEWINSRKLNREEVAAVFDISPPIIHILDRSTFNNIVELERGFYRDTMAPPIESLESALDFHLGSYWQGSKSARFSLDDVLRGDFETRAEAARALATVAGLTPNEIRELMGMDKYVGFEAYRADRLYANAAMQELGYPAERITLTGAVAHDPDGVAMALMGGETPPATRVPSPSDNSSDSGIDVPQLTNSSGGSAMANSAMAASFQDAQVATVDYSLPAVREFRGAVGRGQSIRESAMKLAAKYPQYRREILVVAEIAIAEKNNSAA